MGNPSTTRLDEAASNLLDRWMAHRQQESGEVDADPVSEPAVELPPTELPPAEPAATEPVPVAEVAESSPTEKPDPIETVEEFEEFAHPAPPLGGASGAPSPHDPETSGEASLQAPAPTPATTGAPVPHLAKSPKSPTQPKPPAPVRRPTPTLAPTPGLVLFSPRRSVRHVLTVAAALLAAGVGIAGYIAWQTPNPTTFGVAGGLVATLFLAWKLRGRTTGTHITIENGMLRIAQGNSRHLFPLASAHPPIDILGQPGQRSWKVLIQRRGMPPFVITRRMVEPSGFTEAIRNFRPDA